MIKDITKIVLHKKSPTPEIAELDVSGLLRFIPRRRAVYESSYGGQSVVVKVFLSRFHGRRHFRQEYKGLRRLKQHQIPTAEILTYGRDKKGHYVLVLKKIEHSQDIFTLLENAEPRTNRKKLLGNVFDMLAQMHTAGILQHDLHLGNFLWNGKTVYALDPAQMRFATTPIGRRKSILQLAIMTNSFASFDRSSKKEILGVYFQKRGWLLTDSVCDLIEKKSVKFKHQNIRRGLKKTLRTSKRFVFKKAGLQSGLFDRTIFGDFNLANFMTGLDDTMKMGEVLKRGNTCLVVKIRIDGRDVVIKRYNHKNLWHSIRHTLKGSRAKKCWLFGHRLNWLGIATAKPLAFIEQRKYGLIWQSWIINEFIPGSDIHSRFSRRDLPEQQKQEILAKTYILLNQLTNNKMTHGDLKLTNIRITDEKPVLIDLDSMQFHHLNQILYFYAKKMNKTFQKRIEILAS